MSDLRTLVERMPGVEQEYGGWSFPCPVNPTEAGHRGHFDVRDGLTCEHGACPPGYLGLALRAMVETAEANALGPPPCPDAGPFSRHNSRQCLTCRCREEWVTRQARAAVDDLDDAGQSMRVSGGHLFDLPADSPIWGTAEAMYSAEGQAWMICAPDGRGKTSDACQYGKARLGFADSMWGQPVKPLPPDRSVYYFAMDRPRQMMEAFRRGVTPDMRPMLEERLHIHRGPPPLKLSWAPGQEWLLREVEQTRAGLVVFDSRKDVGNTLDGAEVSGFATAVQLLVAADVEVLILHHPHKGRRNGPPSLEDVSGFREVFSGLGSVLFIDSPKAGDSLVTAHHLKPIREVLPPLRVMRNHATGVSEVAAHGFVSVGPNEVEGGRVPVNGMEVRVLACIAAHPSGEAPAASLKDVLKSDNLSRDLKPLIAAGLIEHNGARGGQSGYRRGPEAPP